MPTKIVSSREQYDRDYNVKFIGEVDGIKIYCADDGYVPNTFGRIDRFTVRTHVFTAECWSKLVAEFEVLRKPNGRDKLFLDKRQLDSLLELHIIGNHEASPSKVQCPRCLGNGKSVLVFSVEDPCSQCGGAGVIGR